jgi:copper chaperone
MKAGKKQGTTMTEFKVEAMHCGHCASAVTEALRRADPVARIDVDLAQKTVRVESSRPRADLAGALSRAGYPPA